MVVSVNEYVKHTSPHSQKLFFNNRNRDYRDIEKLNVFDLNYGKS